MKRTVLTIVKVKMVFAIILLITIAASGCTISVNTPSASPTVTVTPTPRQSEKNTAKKSPTAAPSKKPSKAPESEKPSAPPSEDTPATDEPKPPDQPSGPPTESPSGTEGQKPPDQPSQKPPDQPSQTPPDGPTENGPPKQGDSYVLGKDIIPSVPSKVGNRECPYSENKKGVYQDTPADVLEFIYVSDTVFNDLLSYLNMLKTDYNFIHIADMDLQEPEGYTSLAVESKEFGKIIVLDCYWYQDSYLLEFYKFDGNLERYE